MCVFVFCVFVFFFQAEDGIRDVAVTGVQTCALPISLNYESLSQTAQFVVVSSTASDGGGAATVTVNPTIVVSGARQNISGAIPNGAQLLLANDQIGRASCRERV